MDVEIGKLKARIELDPGRIDSDLKRIEDGIRDVDQEIRKLQNELRAGAIDIGTFDAKLDELIQTQTILRGVASEVTDALKTQGAAMASAGSSATTTGKQMATGMAGAEQATRRSTASVRQMVYAVDDLQYVGEQGLRPIINNIMMISPALGVALIAVDQFSKNWEGLGEVFQSTPFDFIFTGMDGITVRLENAAKATAEWASFGKLNFDSLSEQMKITKELADQEERRKKISQGMKDRLGNFQSDEERKRGEAVKQAMVNDPTGPEGVRQSLLQATMRGRKDLDKMVEPPGGGKKISVRENLTRTVDEMIDSALRGKQAYASTMTSMLGGEKGAFGGRVQEKMTEDQRKADEKAETEAIQKDQSENERRTKRTQERRAKRSRDVSSDLAKDLFPRALAGENIDRAAVETSLNKAGVKFPPEAIDALFANLKADLDKQIKARALSKGMTPREAGADILKDHRERADTEARHDAAETPEARKARLERERGIHARVRQFSPAFDDALMSTMQRHQGAGKTAPESDASLAEQLKTRLGNVPEGIRADVSKAIVEAVRGKFEAKTEEAAINTEMFGNPKGPQRPGSRKPVNKPHGMRSMPIAPEGDEGSNARVSRALDGIRDASRDTSSNKPNGMAPGGGPRPDATPLGSQAQRSVEATAKAADKSTKDTERLVELTAEANGLLKKIAENDRVSVAIAG